MSGRSSEDVRVVELEVVQHQGARAVVHELRPLVEEGGVVLVGLDDRTGDSCVARPADARAGVESRCGAPADEEPGIESGGVEDHREHRGGRGLAVGAGHRDHVPIAQAHARTATPARRRIGSPCLENVLHAPISASHRVADHHDIGRGRELRRIVSRDRRDSSPVEHAVSSAGTRCSSEPVTRWPSSRAMRASPAMKVPQMPRKWTCMGRWQGSTRLRDV